MKPQYSVLIYNKNYNEYREQIKAWLHGGIKVFWFGTKDSVSTMCKEFEDYSKAHLLLAYPLVEQSQSFIITDGDSDNKAIESLGAIYSDFNAEQYCEEHCKTDGHIVVEASAGTGKTTVMIDRIMFLLHTVPGIKLSDIAMITFTNEATNQMRLRLQKVLLSRYKLTRDQKYLYWLEGQADMTISTIDSFSYALIKKCGVVNGLSQGVRIKTLTHERKELIKDTVNRLAVYNANVISQFGLSYYSLCSLTDKFWMKIAQLGLAPKDVVSLNWGRGVSPDSQKFQATLTQIIDHLADQYDEAKSKQDAVTLQDMKRDLNACLPLSIRQKVLTDIGFRYLFVDEFQDSDNSQIALLVDIARGFGVKLFVVGDVKQSIYRFRGAVDSAFTRLMRSLNGNAVIYTFALKNNYRTAPVVMNTFNRYFQKWAEIGYLSYAHPSVACKQIDGDAEFIRTYSRGLDEREFIDSVKDALADFGSHCAKTGATINEKNRVVILARTNRQLIEVAQLLDAHQIPAIVRRDGSFYTSEAVRDFFALINSFVYANEPTFLFDYLCTPYAELKGQVTLDELVLADGDKDELYAKMVPYLKQTRWGYYDQQFRLRPVLSVIKEIIDEKSYIRRIIARKKQIRESAGWDKADIDTSVHAEVNQYQANLEKLMLMLQQNFKSDGVSLNAISQYLKIAIATNREESEADIDISTTSVPLHCMTVHKAKGLEFDTVILPFMDKPFFYKNQTEILVSNDQDKVAWNIHDRKTGTSMRNLLYEQVRKEEDDNATAEETRILYVAMTRTIRNFKCILNRTIDDHTWAGLIWKVGVPDE